MAARRPPSTTFLPSCSAAPTSWPTWCPPAPVATTAGAPASEIGSAAPGWCPSAGPGALPGAGDTPVTAVTRCPGLTCEKSRPLIGREKKVSGRGPLGPPLVTSDSMGVSHPARGSGGRSQAGVARPSRRSGATHIPRDVQEGVSGRQCLLGVLAGLTNSCHRHGRRLTRRVVSDKDRPSGAYKLNQQEGGRRCLLRRVKYSQAWSWQVP